MRFLAVSLFVIAAQAGVARAEQEPIDAVRMKRIDMPVAAPSQRALLSVLRQNRAMLLEVFRDYRLGKNYPVNLTEQSVAHIWVDNDGRACAVANMVRESGANDVFVAIAESDNATRVADVTTGALANWVLMSGFTKEELVLIQRPFQRVTAAKPAPTPIAVGAATTPAPSDAAAPAQPEGVQFAKPPKPAADASLLSKEKQRLARIYAEIEKKLRSSSEASLKLAARRLMANKALAREVMRSIS